MGYDCYCDGDPPEFMVTETRRARKPHQCHECRGTITPGESYEHVRGKWEGDVYTFKTCALCLELRQWATISVPCFCFSYGDLHENVRDMVDGVKGDAPRGFVFEWGRRMIAIQRKRFGVHWPRPVIRAKLAHRMAMARAELRV